MELFGCRPRLLIGRSSIACCPSAVARIKRAIRHRMRTAGDLSRTEGSQRRSGLVGRSTPRSQTSRTSSRAPRGVARRHDYGASSPGSSAVEGGLALQAAAGSAWPVASAARSSGTIVPCMPQRRPGWLAAAIARRPRRPVASHGAARARARRAAGRPPRRAAGARRRAPRRRHRRPTKRDGAGRSEPRRVRAARRRRSTNAPGQGVARRQPRPAPGSGRDPFRIPGRARRRSTPIPAILAEKPAESGGLFELARHGRAPRADARARRARAELPRLRRRLSPR